MNYRMANAAELQLRKPFWVKMKSFVDELVAGVDPRAAAASRDGVKMRGERTIIFSSHNLLEI